MIAKPTLTHSASGGPSYQAWLYEIAAIHRKLDLIMRALGTTTMPLEDEGRLHDTLEGQR